MIEKKEWLLLAISFSEDYLSPAQLQKSLFLLKQKKPGSVSEDFYNFIPYNYGPFCKEIYSDAESLVSEGLVKFGHPVGERWQGYTITEIGKECVKKFENSVSKEDRDYLAEVVTWARSLSFKQLLSAIYKEYPAYKVNSVFPEL